MTTKLFKCHMCDMESKPNALMARHKNKHLSTIYTADQYKKDLWAHNGIHPNICPVCNKETVIAKGDGPEYPKLHDECYKKHWKHGENNPNWQGGLHVINCTECNKEMKKHTSQLNANGIKFCSYKCTRLFYSREENITEKMRLSRIELKARVKTHLFSPEANKKRRKSCAITMSTPEFKAGAAKRMRIRWQDPAYRKKQAEFLATKSFSVSKLETTIFNIIKEIYPDAEAQKFIDFYTCDIWVPSENLLIEVQGSYWHSGEKRIRLDKTKKSFFENRGYKIRYIHETPWRECRKDLNKQLKLIKQCIESETQPLPPHLG